MSTATAFVWNFPLGETMYVFQEFGPVLIAPVALSVGITLLFGSAGFLISLVKRGISRR